jgi:hypothetical protein
MDTGRIVEITRAVAMQLLGLISWQAWKVTQAWGFTLGRNVGLMELQHDTFGG